MTPPSWPIIGTGFAMSIGGGAVTAGSINNDTNEFLEETGAADLVTDYSDAIENSLDDPNYEPPQITFDGGDDEEDDSDGGFSFLCD